MQLRTIVRKQGQQAVLLDQLRNASSKVTPPIRPSIAGKAGPAKAATAAATSSSSSSTATGSSASQVRNRKLTPTAKAKAQASASRALREELASIVAKDGKSQSPEVNAAIHQKARKDDQLAQTIVDQQSNRRLNDAIAFATAESYDFKKLISSNRLPAGWQLLEDDEVIYIPQWPQPNALSHSSTSLTSGGEVFVFQSGSYVTWGLSNEQSSRFLRSVLQGRAASGGKGQSAEVDAYSQIGDEAMEYIVADDQITRVVGDVIVIGQAPRIESDENFDPELVEENDGNNSEEGADWSPLLARLAFSQGLSRSARLSVQEAALSTYLEEVASLPGRLELEGKVPLHRKEVIRKMGTLLKLRQRANLDSENFLDDPEMYWENWKVEHHYDSICLALDIESRFKAYNEKLDHGENLLGVLRALLTESSTHRMELIIIYLIAFEVCLALISHGYPKHFWKLLTGHDWDTEEEETQKPRLQDDEDVLSMLRRLLPLDANGATTAPSHRIV